MEKAAMRLSRRPRALSGSDASTALNVGLADARVAREMKILCYDFVAIDADNCGGVLRVWKTTQ